MLSFILSKEGYEVIATPSPLKALEMLNNHNIETVVQDIKMPEMNGIELLRRIKEKNHSIPVIIITAFSNWDNAVEAMRLGAYDYIKKPFDTDNIRDVVNRAVQQKQLSEQEGADSVFKMSEIIGSSEGMQEVLDVVRRVASTNSTVLIQGESGTGKELVARALHYNSLRRSEAFISVNCGAFVETLLESELFGHKKGSFTGAVQDKKGLLEIADSGTFFLDEVSTMASQTQVKLLRVLEERVFLPVGSTQPRKVDIRLIAATNTNLKSEVISGRFREDLFYRLNVIPLTIPPLRERKSDIPLLAGHFLAVYSKMMRKNIVGISDQARIALISHSWHGNVRELENVIQRAVALCEENTIEEINLAGEQMPESTKAIDIPSDGFNLENHLAQIEKSYITVALKKTGGNLTKAAEVLGMTFRSIRYKVKKLNIDAHIIKDM
ncbi:MAG: sigma-54 dependent transcriptional regulator [Planctomycetota bacterium]